MKEADYAYASAYTRTLENKMLKKSDIEALLSVSSLEEALRILSDKGYEYSKTGQGIDTDTMLKEELLYIWKEVKDACPKDAPIYILLYQNDFHNLKAILKSVFSGVAYESLMMEPYTISPGEIYHAVSEGKIENLPEIIREPAANAYDILARDNDGQLAEIVLDKALFSLMYKAAVSSKNDFLMDWVDLNIALMNMKVALRGAYSGKSREFLRDSMLQCKRINADELANASAQDISNLLEVFRQSGFEEAADAARQSISAFEKWCDNELIRFIQPARYITYGFEPVFGFLVGKQFELKAVRMILSGIRSKIPAEALRERLRDLYV
ncbi:MAG TPA: V-type ATPase subunit [Clostridiales bacterium]|nr:V-type ATPase subunit [Clostridiales bacterium]